MKYILIIYLLGGNPSTASLPTSIEFDTARACMAAGGGLATSINNHTGNTPIVLCNPKGGTDKTYETFYSPVVDFNKP